MVRQDAKSMIWEMKWHHAVHQQAIQTTIKEKFLFSLSIVISFCISADLRFEPQQKNSLTIIFEIEIHEIHSHLSLAEDVRVGHQGKESSTVFILSLSESLGFRRQIKRYCITFPRFSHQSTQLSFGSQIENKTGTGSTGVGSPFKKLKKQHDLNGVRRKTGRSCHGNEWILLLPFQPSQQHKTKVKQQGEKKSYTSSSLDTCGENESSSFIPAWFWFSFFFVAPNSFPRFFPASLSLILPSQQENNSKNQRCQRIIRKKERFLITRGTWWVTMNNYTYFAPPDILGHVSGVQNSVMVP